MHFKTNSQSGFSLVEMLVAISILLIIIVGPMTVTTRIAKSSSFATEQTQAYFYAQEGVELVQKLRDDFMLEYFAGVNAGDDPWDDFTSLAECYQVSEGCGLAWASLGVVAAPVDCGNAASDACLLRLDSADENNNNIYVEHAVGDATPFKRRIKLTMGGTGNNQVKVVSEVTWRTGSLVAEQKVTAETYLYNVYDLP